ncbi:hypothetical protein, partial [Angustibacter aerolatus]
MPDTSGRSARTTNALHDVAARGARRVLHRLPPPVRLRVRQVKRAALGQPPVPVAHPRRTAPRAAAP